MGFDNGLSEFDYFNATAFEMEAKHYHFVNKYTWEYVISLDKAEGISWNQLRDLITKTLEKKYGI